MLIVGAEGRVVVPVRGSVLAERPALVIFSPGDGDGQGEQQGG
ncbi:hypothetical protein [Arthrobacter sp. CAN_C5]|nr:hypothetical protein [Arthrobacter sp. CAN_C5]MBP2217046.1 hypothetical protein [Arthrobacter sp. CAN_C5]